MPFVIQLSNFCKFSPLLFKGTIWHWCILHACLFGPNWLLLMQPKNGHSNCFNKGLRFGEEERDNESWGTSTWFWRTETTVFYLYNGCNGKQLASWLITTPVPKTVSVFITVPSAWKALMNNLTSSSSSSPCRRSLPRFFWGSSVTSIGWSPWFFFFFVSCVVLYRFQIGIFSPTNNGLLQIRETFICFEMSHCSSSAMFCSIFTNSTFIIILKLHIFTTLLSCLAVSCTVQLSINTINCRLWYTALQSTWLVWSSGLYIV